MVFFFWMLWIVNLLILLVCLYETFLVSSNSSLLWPALLMGAILVSSWWLRSKNPRAALAVVGLPVGLVLLYALSLVFRTDWR